MRLGQVVGTVVATCKNHRLEGAKLLLVQPVTPEGKSIATPTIAIDAAHAGVGDTVLVVLEGRAASSALRRRGAPVDAAIIGVVDRVDIPPDPA